MRLRKEKGLTQEALATALSVSTQAVSKWEKGYSYPDIEILPKLTELLETNIDAIIGHVPGDMNKTIWTSVYEQSDDYYWGLQPNVLCYDVLRMCPPNKYRKLLEIGSGEGKDALFFARNGYEVTAFDIAQSGIEKTLRLSDMYRVPIKAFRADMMEYHLKEQYDIIYSSRSLNYLRPEIKGKMMEEYKDHTVKNGYNALNVYVSKPFIEDSPEHDASSFIWKSGELFTYYSDWKLEKIDETIFDCYSSGIYHQHIIDIMLAQKL